MVVSKEAPQNPRAGDDAQDDGEGTMGVVGDVEGDSNTQEEVPENPE